MNFDLVFIQSLAQPESMETEEATPPKPSPMPKKSPAPSPRKPSAGNDSSASVPRSLSGKVGGAVGEVSERLDLYRRAVQQAESAGESSKVRRYKRSITSLEQVQLILLPFEFPGPRTREIYGLYGA